MALSHGGSFDDGGGWLQGLARKINQALQDFQTPEGGQAINQTQGDQTQGDQTKAREESQDRTEASHKSQGPGGQTKTPPDSARILVVSLPSDMPLAEKRRVASLEPPLQVLVVEHDRRLKARGLTRIQINSGRRSPAQQQDIVDRTAVATTAADSTTALRSAGVSGFAAPKGSLHLYGLAYDGEPVPKDDRTWQIFGEEAEALGLVWGGRWIKTLPDGTKRTDRPHVQMPGDSSLLRQLAGVGVFAVLTAAVAVALRDSIAFTAWPALRD